MTAVLGYMTDLADVLTYGPSLVIHLDLRVSCMVTF